MQPKVYISYAPGNSGSLFALLYFEDGADIHGWHIEARSVYFSAAFFMVENFYATRTPRLYRSVEDDVYGAWTIDNPPAPHEHIRCPLPESVAHELERMQSQFVDEWLFFRNDGDISAEAEAYAARGWPVQEVNIRSRRVARLQRQNSHCVYVPPGIDLNVVQLLRKYWRLSEKVPER